MKLTPDIEGLITQIVARDVAAGVELARSIGYKMPKDFAVGVRFLAYHSGNTCIRIRLEDATYNSIVQLPDLNGSLSLKTVDAMWKVAWERVHADALTLAQTWIDKHPEASVDEGALKARRFLDALKDEDMQKWMDGCMERAKSFQYTTVGGSRGW